MALSTRRIILILLAATAVYLAGNARVSLWDRDEPRYAQCSRQMLQSGDWVVPRLYDELRAQKPPLIYWCQATAMKIFGDGPTSGTFAARFPSSLAMVLTLAILAFSIGRHVSPQHAVWTIFIMASSLMTIISAKVCLTDSVLLLFTTIAQLCLFSIWRGNRSWVPIVLMAVMFGLGGLTKGPFIVGIVACTAAALALFQFIGSVITHRPPRNMVAWRGQAPRGFAPLMHGEPAPARVLPLEGAGANADRRHGRATQILAVVAGLILICLIVGPWLYLIHQRAPGFLGKQIAEGKAHLEQGKEGHNLPPGYHFVLIWVTFFPWSFLLPLAIGLGIRYRKVPEVRFGLAAVVGPWLMIEFIGTKLPHYVLSIFPALSFLTASAILRCLKREADDMQRRSFQFGAGCWAIAAIVISLVPWLLAPGFRAPGIHPPKFAPQPYGALWTFTIVGIIYAIVVFLLVRARRFARALAVMGIGMLIMILIASVLYLPNAQFLRTSIHIANVLQRLGATEPGSVIMMDYKEPSLAFYQGGTIREQKTTFLREKHWDQWPRWIVMTRQAWDNAPAEARDRLKVVKDPELPFRGWSYGDGGRTVEVMVVEKRAGIEN